MGFPEELIQSGLRLKFWKCEQRRFKGILDEEILLLSIFEVHRFLIFKKASFLLVILQLGALECYNPHILPALGRSLNFKDQHSFNKNILRKSILLLVVMILSVPSPGISENTHNKVSVTLVETLSGAVWCAPG